MASFNQGHVLLLSLQFEVADIIWFRKKAAKMENTFLGSLGETFLGRQVAELRRNAYNADVTLTCQGEVILAHSFILGMRFVLMYCEFIFKEDP